MTSVDANSMLNWLDSNGRWINALHGNTGRNDIEFIKGTYYANLVLGHYDVDTPHRFRLGGPQSQQ